MMKVRTRNSLYQVTGKGEIIEAVKLENDGAKGEVKVGDVAIGTNLYLASAIPCPSAVSRVRGFSQVPWFQSSNTATPPTT